MKQPVLARDGARHRGVIDTLSAGYALIHRQPWLMLVPILLDVFLWRGPKVSLAALVAAALDAPGLDERSRQMLDQSRPELLQLAGDFNLLLLLAPAQLGPRLGVPSALALVGGGGLGGERPLQGWGDVAMVAVLALLVGLGLSGLFRAGLALQLGQDGIRPGELLRQGLLGAWRLVLLVALTLLLACLAAIPLALGRLVVGDAALVLATLVVLWAMVYCFFAPEIIFVGRVGPWRALRESVTLVHGSFWPALGLIVLTTVILLGMAQVWLVLQGRGAGGMVLAILGNAYVASGLVGASMVFYRERRLQSVAARGEALAAR